MRKKDIMDLILAHYEDDPRLFFRKTLDILKEFKEDGDDCLVQHISSRILPHVKIMPKREETPYEPEVSFEEAEQLGWVPMGDSNG